MRSWAGQWTTLANLMMMGALLFAGCSSMDYKRTASEVNIPRFMGKWYVIAGRFTFLESDAYNSTELYVWNEGESRIDVTFSYNKDSLTGERKSMHQKAWVEKGSNGAWWKISPFWPIKMDYLVLDVDPDYQWCAVGVPNQNYLWIMHREQNPERSQIEAVIAGLKERKYRTDKLVWVEHDKQQ
jgi:apolipoprotein D and lipocalin family protein